ncbi:hypothetical protein QQX98_000604 [Neonectria punicea]|uniref:Alpha/beta hydrolase fold-3 domain-containing protein n=1 Tax=Neonectria punicea TaxID=979145 RepID=A0ABR1HUP3_9HYPO
MEHPVPPPTAVCYRRVGELELFADVYFSDETNSSPRPAMLFFHGRGLVEYTRKHISPYLIQAFLLRGWAAISVDYRLLPQVNGLDILDDIQAAWKWIHNELPAAIPSLRIDADRILVAGQSAGGYLAYLLAAREQISETGSPPPRALLVLYGIHSFSHPFLNTGTQITKYPVPVELLDPFLSSSALVTTGSKDSMKAMVPSYSDDGQIIEGVDLSGVDLPPTLPPTRGDLYDHFVKESLFPTVLGEDLRLDPMLEVGPNYPPTVLIHGTADRVVP